MNDISGLLPTVPVPVANFGGGVSALWGRTVVGLWVPCESSSFSTFFGGARLCEHTFFGGNQWRTNVRWQTKRERRSEKETTTEAILAVQCRTHRATSSEQKGGKHEEEK